MSGYPPFNLNIPPGSAPPGIQQYSSQMAANQSAFPFSTPYYQTNFSLYNSLQSQLNSAAALASSTTTTGTNGYSMQFSQAPQLSQFHANQRQQPQQQSPYYNQQQQQQPSSSSSSSSMHYPANSSVASHSYNRQASWPQWPNSSNADAIPLHQYSPYNDPSPYNQASVASTPTNGASTPLAAPQSNENKPSIAAIPRKALDKSVVLLQKQNKWTLDWSQNTCQKYFENWFRTTFNIPTKNIRSSQVICHQAYIIGFYAFSDEKIADQLLSVFADGKKRSDVWVKSSTDFLIAMTTLHRRCNKDTNDVADIEEAFGVISTMKEKQQRQDQEKLQQQPMSAPPYQYYNNYPFPSNSRQP